MLGRLLGSWRALVVIIAVVTLSYWQIFSGFFQQDEWLAFGFHFLAEKEGLPFILETAFLPRVSHYNPFNFLTAQAIFSVFHLNYQGYAVVSLFLHLVSALLVFYLAQLIFEDKKLSFFAALLFGVMAASFQATAWAFADLGTHGATIFALTSLIYFFLFLKKKENKLLAFTLLFLFASLLFKEIAIGLFLLFPAALLLYGVRDTKNKNYLGIFLAAGVAYVLFRVGMLVFADTSGSIYAQDSSIIVTSQSFKGLLYNLASFPFKGVAQTIIPSAVLFNLAKALVPIFPQEWTGLEGTTKYDLFTHQLLEFLSFALLIIVTVLAFKAWRKGEDRIVKAGLFGLIFVIFNSFIFAFSPERSGVISIIDSRNLYLPAVGTSIFLASLATKLVAPKVKRSLVLLLVLLLTNVIWLNRELEALVEVAEVRRSILAQIRSQYPDLPERAVFYTESDKAFYGLPPEEKIMPFQSGFGQTLLVWYYPSERWPREFLQNRFLWEITEQGYREGGGRGFGYFREFEFLANAVEAENLPLDSVIAFRYDSKNNSFEDISKEVRQKLVERK